MVCIKDVYICYEMDCPGMIYYSEEKKIEEGSILVSSFMDAQKHEHGILHIDWLVLYQIECITLSFLAGQLD